MRLSIRFMASVAALATAAPAAAQERAVSCEQEIAAFLENLRGDDAFPLVEAIIAEFEPDLAEAAEGKEGTCYALLADVQTILRDEGHVISGASDAAAIQRTRRLAADARSRTHFDMRDGDSHASTDVPGESDPAEVTVRQSEPDVTIVEPEGDPEVEFVEPEGSEDRPARAEAPRQDTGSAADPAGDVVAGGAGPARDPASAEDRTGGGTVRVPSEAAAPEAATLAQVEAFAVREVEFGFDSATVPLDETTRILADIAEIVAEDPESAILLTGYASPIGDARYNMELSEARVDAVRDALVDLGVPSGAILARSLGERNTEVAADEGERSPANRRVEIRIVDVAGDGG